MAFENKGDVRAIYIWKVNINNIKVNNIYRNYSL